MANYPYIDHDKRFLDYSFEFLIANAVGEQWYGGKTQELPEFRWVTDHLRPGDTVVDCGAHHGMFSLIMAYAVGATGQVISYEALPSNADVIRRNAELNGLSNVRVRPVGVGSKAGQFTCVVNSSNSMVIDVATDDGEAETVTIVRLDDELPVERVDMIKIDVEGFELQALEGAAEVIARRPVIDLELHNFMMPNRTRHVRDAIAMLPGSYVWQVLDDDILAAVGEPCTLDPAHLATMANPHLLGVPLERISS